MMLLQPTSLNQNDLTATIRIFNAYDPTRGESLANRIGEVATALLAEGHKEEGVWVLMQRVLEELNAKTLSIQECHLLYFYFLWSVFKELGYRPNLEFCSQCRKTNSESIFFRSGAFVCSSCAGLPERENQSIIQKVSRETLLLLQKLLSEDLSSLLKEKILAEKELFQLSHSYLQFIL